MHPDAGAARELLDAVIAAFAVLGGTIAYVSGLAAAQADASGAPPSEIGLAINVGIAEGFRLGVPLAAAALTIVVWS